MEALERLLEALAGMGMGEEGLEKVREMFGINLEALEEQVRHHAGGNVARRMAEEARRDADADPDLIDRPFRHIDEEGAEALREEVRRLAAQLRSRAALRHRRGKKGVLDPTPPLRASLRNGGVPIELRLKTRRLKSKLVLICDISTSVRHCAEFMLRLIYELQDQVARARSFAFIDRMEEISGAFEGRRPDAAVKKVLRGASAGPLQHRPGGLAGAFFRPVPGRRGRPDNGDLRGGRPEQLQRPAARPGGWTPPPRPAHRLDEPGAPAPLGNGRQRHAGLRPALRPRPPSEHPGRAGRRRRPALPPRKVSGGPRFARNRIYHRPSDARGGRTSKPDSGLTDL